MLFRVRRETWRMWTSAMHNTLLCPETKLDSRFRGNDSARRLVSEYLLRLLQSGFFNTPQAVGDPALLFGNRSETGRMWTSALHKWDSLWTTGGHTTIDLQPSPLPLSQRERGLRHASIKARRVYNSISSNSVTGPNCLSFSRRSSALPTTTINRLSGSRYLVAAARTAGAVTAAMLSMYLPR